MRAVILALSLFLALPAAADECDARAARIAAEVGGSVRMRIGPAIKLLHPAVESFSVDCEGASIRRVSASKAGPGPMSPMALLVARTASLALPTTEKAAAGVMLQCIRAAAAKAGDVAEAKGQGLRVKCYVLRDFVTMDVDIHAR